MAGVPRRGCSSTGDQVTPRCPRQRWGGGAWSSWRSPLSSHTLFSAGSYYLTTTYGALEHIKNYDKITVTRQLSVEVQDSIHRWERRRTLNKARASRSSVQVMGT